MKRFFLLSASALLASVASSQAVLLIADFNDIATGIIQGKAGGTGFSGVWGGSANPTVVAGNLTSTLYNVPQSGTGQAVIGTNNGTRQNFRTVTTSPTGEIWFSFLAQTNVSGTDTDSAGISFNAPTVTPFGDRGTYFINFTGTSVTYNFGAASITTVADVTTSGATNLVVGRLVISPGITADSVTIWINPDLVANPNINTYTPFYTSTANNIFDTISNVGLIAFETGTAAAGGKVDHIRISDGGGNPTQAYQDVALIPEPSAALLAAGSLALGALVRRRR